MEIHLCCSELGHQWLSLLYGAMHCPDKTHFSVGQ